ncbi:pyridoxal-phosphate dependent enzyme [Candidatus Uabimicrobium amorphum]|uniref:L-serine ammonia-lyase n=1 Tax=Uabimicrobium amorphum TaxID=2596890 RepID=A0A5S9IS94_UABAM|nr:pyridoxal-phosphate dependent enzyme [Candidatus Uabimicrobium amorphum]BBM87169.1 serine/threonine dehydratase [Candidatus Uabimicrobium amorphum]
MHIKTPLLESRSLSQKVPGTVWLKMDALQPSGSFKVRGIGFACREYAHRGTKKFISSSGGNAGVAVAFCGRKLNIPVSVVVPKSTTERAKELTRLENAEVIVHGDTWNEAHLYAMELVDDSAAYIHPFDDPLLWQGHASIIDEICENDITPDLVIVSVGGGGLLCGVIEGLQRNKLKNTRVLAMETQGAESLHLSLQQGSIVTLPEITSIATSLGAKKIAQHTFESAQKCKVISNVVSDSQAIDACLQFIRDHRIVVEPACGAALAPLYQSSPFLREYNNIVVIVCGGVVATLEQLHQWQKSVG